MNSTGRPESLSDSSFVKSFINFTLGVIINSINGSFVYIYFKNEVFWRDPRYILYIHLVINDMIILTTSVSLQIILHAIVYELNMTICCIMLVILVTTNKNSTLNLVGMAVERYIAVCHPLHHTQICTVQRTYALIGLIWGVSFIPAFTDIIILLTTQPVSFFSGTVHCVINNVFRSSHSKTQSVVVQVIYLSFVFLTLIFTYIKVFFAARAVTTDQASARKARNTILLHGFQLLICMMSYCTPLIITALVAVFPTVVTDVVFSSYVVTNVLPRLLSPLIYGLRDQQFMSYMRLYLSCKCCSSVAKKVKPMSRAQVKYKRKEKRKN